MTPALGLDRKGLSIAASAFVLWGLMPLYWHLLKAVPSLQIVAHRVLWSAVLVALWLLWSRGRGWFAAILAKPRLAAMLTLSGLCIGINWGLYIWAVNAGHVVETALGYFINPLLNVVIGVLFLRERLRPLQWASVAIAAVGVLWLTMRYGQFPWIAIALAVSFGIYGVLRKLAHVDSVTGLGVESAYLFVPVLGVLLWSESHGTGGFLPHADAPGYGPAIDALLVLSGLVTALPLVGFAYAVRRISLTSVGLLQFIAPTLQFLIGVFVFAEPFDRSRLVGFACIWLALAVFVADSIHHSRRLRPAELA